MSKKAVRERDLDGDRPSVDWIVYVPRPVESVLPPPSRVEALNGLGSIVVVQPDPLAFAEMVVDDNFADRAQFVTLQANCTIMMALPSHRAVG